MFEITAFEARRRVRGAIYLSVSLLAYAWLVVGLFPSIKSAAVDIQAYIESLPPEVQRAFVADASSYTTIEGFLSTEMYQLVILLLLGMFFAYAAASSIAGEVEHGSMGLLLANPVSRSRVVIGKFLSLVPIMVGVNVVLLAGTYVATGFIREQIALSDLVRLHAASIPYLLACAALGIAASVVFDTARRAQVVAAGGVFAMFLVDAVTTDTDYDWIGQFAFTRYFDVNAVLVKGDVDWVGMAILLAAAVVLVVLAAEYFERTDVG